MLHVRNKLKHTQNALLCVVNIDEELLIYVLCELPMLHREHSFQK